MNPRAAAFVKAGAVGGGLAAGDEDDIWRLHPHRQQVGHSEAVKIRELDVEQHDVGAQPLHFVERVASAGSLADNVETLRLQSERAASRNATWSSTISTVGRTTSNPPKLQDHPHRGHPQVEAGPCGSGR